MPNGRCRMHGGKSAGPRTAEGIDRIRKARTIHGGRSAEMIALRREMARRARLARAMARAIEYNRVQIYVKDAIRSSPLWLRYPSE